MKNVRWFLISLQTTNNILMHIFYVVAVAYTTSSPCTGDILVRNTTIEHWQTHISEQMSERSFQSFTNVKQRIRNSSITHPVTSWIHSFTVSRQKAVWSWFKQSHGYLEHSKNQLITIDLSCSALFVDHHFFDLTLQALLTLSCHLYPFRPPFPALKPSLINATLSHTLYNSKLSQHSRSTQSLIISLIRTLLLTILFLTLFTAATTALSDKHRCTSKSTCILTSHISLLLRSSSRPHLL